MLRFNSRKLVRVLLGTALLATGLVAGPFTVHTAGATLSTCGGALCLDPTIFFSDGTKIITGVGVDDNIHDIQGITYTVHVPAGVTVTRVTYQGSRQVNQSVQVSTDEQSQSAYDVDTQVFTGTAGISVTPYTRITRRGDGLLCSTMGAGLSNQDVFVHLDC